MGRGWGEVLKELGKETENKIYFIYNNLFSMKEKKKKIGRMA